MYRSSSSLPIKYKKGLLINFHCHILTFRYNLWFSEQQQTAWYDILCKKVAKKFLCLETTESSPNVYKDINWLPLHIKWQASPPFIIYPENY